MATWPVLANDVSVAEISYFFAEAFHFSCFKCVRSSISIHALESLSANSSISFMSVLAFIDCFFFFYSWGGIPGCWYDRRLLIDAWAFLSYVLRNQVLFQSVFAVFFWHSSDRGRGALLVTVRWREEPRFPLGPWWHSEVVERVPSTSGWWESLAPHTVPSDTVA